MYGPRILFEKDIMNIKMKYNDMLKTFLVFRIMYQFKNANNRCDV